MDAIFVLKKWLGLVLMPSMLVTILLIFALIGLWRYLPNRWPTWCVTLAALLFISLSTPRVAGFLANELEWQQPPLNRIMQADYVVVLGHGHVVNPQVPVSSWPTAIGTQRLVEGLRVLQQLPNAKLILSGYNGGETQSYAKTASDLAQALGVPSYRIILLENTKDTAEEATEIANLVGHQPTVVVSSAAHLARAMRDMRSHGINAIPAPVGYSSTLLSAPLPLYREFPAANYFMQAEASWHEILGGWFQGIQSLVADQKADNVVVNSQQ